MTSERWFISYRYIEREFIDQSIKQKGYGATITDVQPAKWLLYSTLATGMEYNILYAEEISLALAGELVHSGTRVHAHYYCTKEV